MAGDSRLAFVAAAVFIALAVETARASRNEARQRARGGIEPAGDVYPLMRVAYPAAFLAMLAESTARSGPSSTSLVAGAAVFVAAKALKWWAIVTLGDFWTFRVIVVPGA